MDQFSFIHTADLHLDSPFKSISFYREEVREILLGASILAYERLIDRCIQENVDFLLISGDIYDGDNVGVRSQFIFYNGLKRLSDLGISTYVLLGNHDPVKAFSVIENWPENAHFFPTDRVETYERKITDSSSLYITGRSFDHSCPPEDVLNGYTDDPGKGLRIALYHGEVGESVQSARAYGACTISELVACPVDYWALGHIHSFSILRRENPWIVYPGTLQGRSIKPSECGPKGAVLVKGESGRISSVKHFPLGEVEFQQLELRIDEDLSPTSLIKKVQNELLKLISDSFIPEIEPLGSINNSSTAPRIPFIRLRLLMLSGKSLDLLSTKKKNDFDSLLREVLWKENKVFLIDTFIEYFTSTCQHFVQDVISASKKIIEELNDPQHGSRDPLLLIFSDEQKLKSPLPEVSRSELEKAALALIENHLSRIEIGDLSD